MMLEDISQVICSLFYLFTVTIHKPACNSLGIHINILRQFRKKSPQRGIRQYTCTSVCNALYNCLVSVEVELTFFESGLTNGQTLW